MRSAGPVALAAACLLTGAAAPAAAIQVQEEPAADASVAYTGEVAANVDGGLRRGVVGLGNLDATLRLNGDALLGWEGTTLFLYGLANHGGEPTELTGDAQVVSNIEAPDAIRLYEAWVEQNLAGPRLSILAGLYDVNSEFDVIDEAGLFLNSSFGIGAEFGNSGANGPSIFPVTSLGTRIQWHPTHQLYVQGAVLDGVPGDPDDPGATAIHLSSREGVLWVAEVGWLAHRSPRRRREDVRLGRAHVHEGIPWRVAVGAWQYTRRAERIAGDGRVRGRPGLYLLAEGRPHREDDGVQGLGAFVRLGVADGRTNRFARYAGAGLTYTGLLPGRDRDVAGIGVASAHNGEPFEEARRAAGEAIAGSETTFDLTYRARLSSRFVVQPDLQLVLNPDTDPALGHALLATLRVVVEL